MAGSQTPPAGKMFTLKQCSDKLGVTENEIANRCCVVEEGGAAMVPAEELERLRE